MPGCQKADEVHKELRSHTDDLQTLIMTAQLRASYLFPLLLAGFVQTNPKPEKMKVSDFQRKWVRVQMWSYSSVLLPKILFSSPCRTPTSAFFYFVVFPKLFFSSWIFFNSINGYSLSWIWVGKKKSLLIVVLPPLFLQVVVTWLSLQPHQYLPMSWGMREWWT